METEVMDTHQQNGAMNQSRRCETCNHSNQPECPGEVIVQEPASVLAEFPSAGGIGHAGSDESLADSTVITSEDALLLPDHVPVIAHKLDKETPSPETCPAHSAATSNGCPLVCTPPPGTPSHESHDAAQVHKCNGHKTAHKKRPPSTSKSQQSLKASGSQTAQAAENDCCVRCVLACLFCEVLSLCSAVAQCLACGMECDALCCCGEAFGGLACCSEDPCSAILDCAILEDCCQSADCLEICLECCSICFPT